LKISLPDFSYALSDDSTQCDASTLFIKTFQNARYEEVALKNGAPKSIAIHELSEYFGLNRIKIVGITGTNGKTTTASAIYSILLDCGYKCALQGTRGFYINDEQVEEKSLTTPSVLHTYLHIYQAVQASCDFFIMEVSSHAIVQQRIEGLNFSLKILTNITQDHLDFHKSFDEYVGVKNSFFKDESPKLINKDEPLASFNSVNTKTYSIEAPSTYRVMAYRLQEGCSGIVKNIEKMQPFVSELQGFFNCYNIVAAIGAVDMLTPKSLEEITSALENFAGVSGRMEVVSQHPHVIVDFAHTPDGIEKVLSALKQHTLLVVFGAGGDRDRSKRPLMSEAVKKYAKKSFLTSDNPRFEEPQQIIDDLLQPFSSDDELFVHLDRKVAITKALEEQEADEIVVILGKGDETYQMIYDQKLPFDDREIVRAWLSTKH